MSIGGSQLKIGGVGKKSSFQTVGLPSCHIGKIGTVGGTTFSTFTPCPGRKPSCPQRPSGPGVGLIGTIPGTNVDIIVKDEQKKRREEAERAKKQHGTHSGSGGSFLGASAGVMSDGQKQAREEAE